MLRAYTSRRRAFWTAMRLGSVISKRRKIVIAAVIVTSVVATISALKPYHAKTAILLTCSACSNGATACACPDIN